ncbi:MAG: glycerol-3-phosphate 1-O-acyltransferase PlsY [Rhodobacteraceae bacterium]|nr:glycerol-3-phosphate 1-O-acyltransferase PlsY [Paracoccaceae bacterium]
MPEIQASYALLAFWGIVGYLLGSIPFGMIVARTLGLGNLREIGSGNIGATNVLRTGNKLAAAVTLLLDGAKGVVAVLLARAAIGEDAAQLAGLMAFIGHCFPIWLSFRGGKGVATFLGVLLGLAWPVGLACCLTWVLSAAATRISSMAAIYAAALSTIWIVFLGYSEMFVLGVVLTMLVFFRHAANIRRLRSGTEPRIGQS